MSADISLGRRFALLVVDVQRDFCPGGALPAPGGDRIIPAINAYLTEAQELSVPIYASRDWHPAVTTHFKPYGGPWPPHCVQGSAGAEFHPDLELPPGAIVISKGEDPERPGYSAFDGHTADGQSFLDDLRHRRVDRLYITGLTTEYCVKQTALDALRAGLHVIILTDAIAGINVSAGDVDRAQSEMAHAGADLTIGLARQAPDVVLLGVEWQPRALIRAQLIEEGFEVVATDTWPMMRRQLTVAPKPRLAIVDLKGLPDPAAVLNDLRESMNPDRVLVLTAMGTIEPGEVEHLGFRHIDRPVAIGDLVNTAAQVIRAA